MKRLYSIRDLKARDFPFSPPFVASSNAEAMRSVQASMTPTSMLTRYPDDYELHCIGHFDQASGRVDGSLELEDMGFVAHLNSLVTKEASNG